jgi:hypothetical protein
MTIRLQIIVGYSVLGLIVLLSFVGWQFGAFTYIDDNLNRRYKVEGAAMEPTLCGGETLAFHKPDPPFDRFEIVVSGFISRMDLAVNDGS